MIFYVEKIVKEIHLALLTASKSFSPISSRINGTLLETTQKHGSL